MNYIEADLSEITERIHKYSSAFLRLTFTWDKDTSLISINELDYNGEGPGMEGRVGRIESLHQPHIALRPWQDRGIPVHNTNSVSLFTLFTELQNEEITKHVNSDNIHLLIPMQVDVLMVGEPGTPYEGGFFYFRVHFPPNYPKEAPKVKLVNTGGGRVCFNPNIYADGRVCHTMLGYVCCN